MLKYFLMLCLLFSPLWSFHPTIHGSEKTVVVVTMPILRSVVKEVGGDLVEVKCIIPAGADPHTYEPSERVILSTLSNASLIVMSGPSHLIIEKKIRELRERGVLGAQIIDYRDYEMEGLTLLSNMKTGKLNPHGYMFSLNGLESIAKASAKKLMELDPENAVYYRENLQAYLSKISSIRRKISSLNLDGAKVILLGPPTQYIAEDLGLDVVDWILPELSIEVTEEDLLRIEGEIRSGKADLVLLSDLGLSRHGKLLNLLRYRRIPYIVVPVLSLLDEPQTISLYAAVSIKYGLRGVIEEGGYSGNSLLIPSIAGNIILTILLILLVMKVRSYAKEY